MRARKFVLIVFLSLPIPADQPLSPVPCRAQPAHYLMTDTDVRHQRILMTVLRKARIDPSRFAICEREYVRSYAEITPYISYRGWVHEIHISPLLRSYTDTELTGVIAHEVAHVVLPGVGRSLEGEAAIDRKSAEWVGKDVVAAALRATLLKLDHVPAARRGYSIRSLNRRIDMIERENN